MTAENMKYPQQKSGVASKTPKAIAWDLGDTLVHFKIDKLQKAAERIKNETGESIPVSELEKAIRQELLDRTSPEEKQKIKAVKNDKDEREYWLVFYRNVTRRLEIDMASDGLIDSLANMQTDPDSFECLPDVHQTLENLNKHDITLILISNAFPSAYKILEHHQLGQYFAHIVMSHDISSLKPEPEIYEHALLLAELPAHTILFVDDRVNFVEGAQRVGMGAVWLNSQNDQYPAWDGCHIIKNVKEVLELAGFPIKAEAPTNLQDFNRLFAERLTSSVCM